MPVKKIRMRSNKKKSKRMRTHMRSKSKNNKRMTGGQRRNKRYTRKHKHIRNPRHIHSEYMMHGGGSPSPWIGSPYDATDLKPSGNFLPLSYNGVPSGLPVPPVNSNRQFSQMGGRSRQRSSSRKNKQRGGASISDFMSTMIPDDILNIGRSIPAAASNLMDQFSGRIPSASTQVYPTQQPLVNEIQQARVAVSPPDINRAYSQAVSSVRNT